MCSPASEIQRSCRHCASEVVAPEIAGSVQGFIANRVPDARFLLDYMLAGAIPCTARPDFDRIAIVGHSAGGWTALALPETDTRILVEEDSKMKTYDVLPTPLNEKTGESIGIEQKDDR
jgi:hypothetical protein